MARTLFWCVVETTSTMFHPAQVFTLIYRIDMVRTTVKVYLKDKDGKKDSFVTPINLPEDEAHQYYIGKWWNMGIEGDYMMKCYAVETIKVEDVS